MMTFVASFAIMGQTHHQTHGFCALNRGRIPSMSIILGSGDYTYRPQEGWGKLPDGWDFGDVCGVAIDSKESVYVFNRGQHPMVVFDREGNFLRSWGEGVFTNPHGAFIGPDDTIYCTDDGDHSVRHCTLDGKVLMTLGIPGKPTMKMSGQPFCRCRRG